jgi:hypothetical protein
LTLANSSFCASKILYTKFSAVFTNPHATHRLILNLRAGQARLERARLLLLALDLPRLPLLRLHLGDRVLGPVDGGALRAQFVPERADGRGLFLELVVLPRTLVGAVGRG